MAERLARDYDLCLADIGAKAPLLHAIQTGQGFTVNLCGAQGVRTEKVTGSFASACTDLPESRPALTEALRQADLVLTAVGKKVLDKVVAVIAPILNARTRQGWLLFCENGLNVAEEYASRFGEQMVLADTVMSRMCRFGEPGERGYRPMGPEATPSLVVEEYGYLPLDAGVCGSGPFTDVFSLVSHADFLCWEDIKFYLHNGMHAFVAYHAYQEGTRFFPEVSDRIRQEAQRVMLVEVVPAILRTHPAANPETVTRYGLSLLERFFNPSFNDSIERGVRGIEEKLAPGERLLGGCEFIRRAGIEPVGYATTIEVARAILAR
jgi:mannitol-1-phosphate/altronate dehydrogenase